ncbi:MAG: sulfatase/phosphatase domain-containing protein, partial [Bacteroidota bacterium]
AQLRSKLETLKLEANTIIIFTSDHGLFMGEFGLGGKALCYEKTTHVPLIIYDPTLAKSKRSGTNHALVQSIDIAPTMLAKAGIDIPKTFQGKDLNPLLNRQVDSVRRYLFTENLWSTHFGNPRCESIKDQSWKYIRYYENHNLSATKKIALAKQLGIKVNRLLYGFHDEDIVRYREYVEAPLAGEKVVYEELYHLAEDPDEVYNLVDNPRYQQTLERLRAAWAVAIKTARGSGAPQVLRYTVESRMENK